MYGLGGGTAKFLNTYLFIVHVYHVFSPVAYHNLNWTCD